MRILVVCLSLALAAGCSPPSADVPQDPPPRLASQTSDLPPPEFFDAGLVVSRYGRLRPYCFHVDELISWLEREKVLDQRWTLLESEEWRLDGFRFEGKEHTVWVFEQSEDGVELVGYKDSDRASRDHRIIMEIYYPHISGMHSDDLRRRFGGCENPYD